MEELKKGNGVPLYYQLKTILRGKIESGEWEPGEQIQSEPEMSASFQVSRATIRQAIAGLVDEGLLIREQGRGTFVARPKLEQGLLGFYSFTGDMLKRGLRPTSRIVSVTVTAATRSVGKRLLIAQGTRVVALTRLRLADDEPLMLETSYLPSSAFPRLEDCDFSAKPLYEIMAERYGTMPVRAKEAFEPVLVDEFEGSMLGVRPGSPGLLLERLTYARDDVPVEYCRGIVRGDRCRYYVELVVESKANQE